MSLTVANGYNFKQTKQNYWVPSLSYPSEGGLYSVAYTDVVQLGCIFVGLVRLHKCCKKKYHSVLNQF